MTLRGRSGIEGSIPRARELGALRMLSSRLLGMLDNDTLGRAHESAARRAQEHDRAEAESADLERYIAAAIEREWNLPDRPGGGCVI